MEPRVYVLWAEGTRRFKIGYTRGLVDDRAAAIMAMSPLPLRIVAEALGTRRDEMRLHAALRQYRSHGEWFSLPEPAVWWLLRQCGIAPEPVA
jgi:hypothetical protein